MKRRQLSCAIAIAALVCCMHSKTLSQTDWHITGNSGTSALTNFVGTTDNMALAFRTNNSIRMRINSNGNIGIGTTAPVQKLDVNGNINFGKGFSLFMENHRILKVDSAKRNIFLGNGVAPNNTGLDNTASGSRALFENISGSENTAYGISALQNNTLGGRNVATGGLALFSNGVGRNNTATGYAALTSNDGANNNVATGTYALYVNTEGSDNTAGGYRALFNNNTGIHNTATGSTALANNITGSNNTATGYRALAKTTGDENNAYGADALGNNTTGVRNIGIGNGSLYFNGTGEFNTGVGYGTLYATTSSLFNTAIGYGAGDSYNNGWNNVFIGANSDVNGADYYNVVAIGEGTICTSSNQARIGKATTKYIGGYANWTNVSDGRVKRNIKENVPGLAFINKLKPVTYNLDLDAVDKIIQPPAKKDKLIASSPIEINARNAKQQILYTGFVAQDVEKAAKELNYNFSGVDAAKNDKDLYGLRYAEFVVPLVKAVQELSQKVEKLEAALAEKNSGTASTTLLKNIILSNTSLEQNVPNPFNQSTKINYFLPQSRRGGTSAKIIVTDKSGKTLKEVNISGAGKSNLNIDASNLPSGVYQYSLYVDGKLIGANKWSA